jgi:6-pyruvoyltetrahydropterin/6-carboxytetrahydropterin synthase
MSISLKRRGTFSAAHNFWLKSCSAAENAALFGPWAAEEGHGHNYVVEVTVGGELDQRTGMVVNIVEIDKALKSTVLSVLDRKFLNKEVDYFFTRIPTLENVTAFVWERLEPVLPQRVALTGVRVYEMPEMWADREVKDAKMTVSLTRSYEFAASHRLHSRHLSDEENQAIFGKCNNPNGHGHNYVVEVTVAGEPDERTGMLYALETLDKIVDEEVLKPFDHNHLNLDVPAFDGLNPTSEVVTLVIWDKLAKRIGAEGGSRLAKVVVRETARNSFEYSGV